MGKKLPKGIYDKLKEKYPDKYSAFSNDALIEKRKRGNLELLQDLNVVRLEMEKSSAAKKNKAAILNQKLYGTNTTAVPTN